MRHRSFTSEFMQAYSAPWWLPGGNLQTIWPAVFAHRTRGPVPAYRRARWPTPDGDFVDLDFLANDVSTRRPLIVLFHGLEGSSRSHYSEAFADVAWRGKLTYVVPHFRGCSGEPNLAPRAYHSGDHEEVDFILRRLRQQHKGPIVAVGVSLGGNALLRWAAEVGDRGAEIAQAVAAVSSPLDLMAGGYRIGRGFNRMVYTTMFLHTMKPKALQKWAQHPGLFDRDALMRARDLYEFDSIFTAPVHGFTSTEDYWSRASAKPHLHRIRIPALALNALNDPFVPAASLPKPKDVSSSMTLWQPPEGGHVGFPSGGFPGHVMAMPEAVTTWLLQASGITPQVPQEWPDHPMTVPAAL
ncbi:YheT family hydrolase [Ramlibacter sp. AN1133]|uniref:YheT family hydrolase n=1 Tax=Ramlibacter sp. AN1133 TaxID=3133429 RepID=UPI0030C09628